MSFFVIIDYNDLEDEDIDEDVWGLIEEEKVKRVSICVFCGGIDLVNVFKVFVEKEKVVMIVEWFVFLIDVMEEDEIESLIKIKEDI